MTTTACTAAPVWERITSNGRLIYWCLHLRSGEPGRWGEWIAVAKKDDGLWWWQWRDGPGDKGLIAYGRRSSSALARKAAERFLAERECIMCAGPCDWADDAWTCRDCGDEWPPDCDRMYRAPDLGAT